MLLHGMGATGLVGLLAAGPLCRAPSLRATLWHLAVVVPPISATLAMLLEWQPLTGVHWLPAAVGTGAVGASLAPALLLVAMAITLHLMAGVSRSLALAEGAELDGPHRRSADAMARRWRLRRPLRLIHHDRTPVPMAIAPRTIVIPSWAIDGLPDEECRAAIAHELAHLVRRDPLRVTAARWVARCCWFQPFGFIALHRLRAAVEESADAFAAHETGGLPLASCLARLATRLSPEPVTRDAVAAIATSRSGLTRRVELLLAEGRPPAAVTSRHLATGLATALLLLLAFLAPRLAQGRATSTWSSMVGKVTTVASIWTPDDATPSALPSGRYP